MSIFWYPQIPQTAVEDLVANLASKQDSALTIGTGTSTAIDFTTNKLQEISISANATLTITGLAVGETGVIFVSNTHATTGASVALPDVLTETNSAYVPALTTVRITVQRLTSTYSITWTGALS